MKTHLFVSLHSCNPLYEMSIVPFAHGSRGGHGTAAASRRARDLSPGTDVLAARSRLATALGEREGSPRQSPARLPTLPPRTAHSPLLAGPAACPRGPCLPPRESVP